MQRYIVRTYGCQMNVAYSNKIKSILSLYKKNETTDIKKADIIILNTCTIRESAANKIFGMLNEIKSLKKKNPDLILIITGCLAQELGHELIQKYEFINAVIGNQNLDILKDVIQNIHKQKCFTENLDKVPEFIDIDYNKKYTAYIPIIYGCNNFCTYCIVPYVTGCERSEPLKNILSQTEKNFKKNVKEILLIGQNVNSYGKDIGSTFSELLSEICKIDKKFRLRFISPHPRDFSDELIEVIASDDKICKSLHIPLQSGSSKILDSMNRGYTKEEFIDLIDKIRKKIPDCSFTTDIIVGFPGETDNDFLDTLEVVKKVKFDDAYMFMYSQRKGTKASELKEQISKDVKKNRLKKLMNIQTEISNKNSQKYLGQILEVLVEGPSKKNESMFLARSDSQKIVLLKKDTDIFEGDFVSVKITDAKTWTLYGKRI